MTAIQNAINTRNNNIEQSTRNGMGLFNLVSVRIENRQMIASICTIELANAPKSDIANAHMTTDTSFAVRL